VPQLRKETNVNRLTRNISLLLFAAAAARAQTGSIQGTITDDSRLPVSNAYVVATFLGPGGHPTRTALTSAAGQYALGQAAPGPYMLCVQSPGSPYLDPCVWSSPTNVTVTAGQVTTANISVVKGTLLSVRIVDQQQYLANASAMVLLGFTTAPSGRFHPLRIATKDPLGQTHDTAIPWSTALHLEVVSNKLLLSDVNNTPLGAVPSPIPIQQATGQGNLNMTFHIIGTR
jgi:hypothetical protein